MGIADITLAPLMPALSGGHLILVPNQVTAQAILRSWAAIQTTAVWCRPRVLPVDLWVRETWHTLARSGEQACASRVLLDSNNETLLWMRVIRETDADHPLLHTGATAQMASQAYQLLRQWQPDGSVPADVAHCRHIPDVARFNDWRNRFESQTQRHGVISLVDALTELVRRSQGGAWPEAQGALLVNFLDPPPLYQALLDALQRQGAHRINTLAVADGQPAAVIRRQFATPEVELDACARWAADWLQRAPEAHLGIITRNVSQVAAPLDEQLRRIMAPLSIADPGGQHPWYNTAVGIRPLTHAPLVDHALALLGWNAQTLSTTRVLSLLLSPFLARTRADDAVVARLQVQLRRHGESHLRLAVLRDQVRALDSAAPLVHRLSRFADLGRAGRPLNTPRIWADRWQAQLAALGWPGTEGDGRERLLQQRFEATLDEFRQTSDWMGDLALFEALELFRTLLSGQSMPRDTDIHRGLSLLQPSEARGLRFDHLWILSVDDQQWPARSHPSALLPFAWQKARNMPGSGGSHDAEAARALLDDLLLGTRSSAVLSHADSDGDRRLRAAPLLRNIPQAPASESDTVTDTWAAALQAPVLEPMNDVGPVPLADGERLRGGAALLTQQRRCPFQAFAAHRLGADPLPTLGPGLSASARGTAVHLALKWLYHGPEGPLNLAAPDPSETSERIQSAALAAVTDLRRRHPETMTPRFSRSQQEHLVTVLQGVVETDRKRPPFTVVDAEAKRTLSVAGLQFNLRIDRIDRVHADDSLLLIDYKTGSQVSLGQWRAEDPDDLQLAIYTVAEHASSTTAISGALIAQVGGEETRYRGVTQATDESWYKAPGSASDWDTLWEAWPRWVTTMAEDFRAGVHTVAPRGGPGTCAQCGRQALCRVALTPDSDDLESDIPGDDA